PVPGGRAFPALEAPPPGARPALVARSWAPAERGAGPSSRGAPAPEPEGRDPVPWPAALARRPASAARASPPSGEVQRWPNGSAAPRGRSASARRKKAREAIDQAAPDERE
ncbi:MAG: hypothetical protein ACXWLF_11255, partial [Myxococcaceae bacterium]